MKITDELETGRLYYWKRSHGWDWFGEQRWWEVFVTLDGFNGGGGLWITEEWRWNNSFETMHQQPRTLTAEDSADLVEALTQNLTTQALKGSSQ